MADRMLGVTVRAFSQVDPAGESTVVYLPQVGGQYPIRGVFDRAYIAVTPGTEASFSSAAPVLGVQLSQFVTPPEQDDRVQIDGVRYRVDDVQPDGTAGALLKLIEE